MLSPSTPKHPETRNKKSSNQTIINTKKKTVSNYTNFPNPRLLTPHTKMITALGKVTPTLLIEAMS